MSSTKETVAKLDLNLRHKSGMTSDEFIAKYCEVFRKHAYATRDDSLNEFEKEITHVLGMMLYYRRFCEILGFKSDENFDPRDFVQAYEDSQRSDRSMQIEKAKQMIEAMLPTVDV